MPQPNYLTEVEGHRLAHAKQQLEGALDNLKEEATPKIRQLTENDSMNAFVIAKKNSEFLDTPVFRAGQSGEEEAIAVFTSHESAGQYINDARWSDEYEVGELQPIQLVRWLAVAHEEGTEMVVVNPDRSEHLEGTRQNVIYLNEPFESFADLLNSEIIKQADKIANADKA